MATISSTLERVDYNSDDGSIQTGAHRQIIDGVGATRTLLRGESGALCLFDSASGVVYTLPDDAAVGAQFEFATTVTITSNAAKVITGAATEFILGTVFGYTTDATEIDGFSANGSTHVAISSNGSTTGGVIGDRYTLTKISATQWLIEGNIFCGTATPADPFATS